jgi:hypothetical protein
MRMCKRAGGGAFYLLRTHLRECRRALPIRGCPPVGDLAGEAAVGRRALRVGSGAAAVLREAGGGRVQDAAICARGSDLLRHSCTSEG